MSENAYFKDIEHAHDILASALVEFQKNPFGGAKKIGPHEPWDSSQHLYEGKTDAASLARISRAQSPEELGKTLLDLAKDPETFTLGPKTDSKDMQTLLNHFAGDRADKIQLETHYENGKFDGFSFQEGKGKIILLVAINAHDFHVNSFFANRSGAPVLQAIYAWAHNNNKTIVEDPHGMTPIGIKRRNAHMLSSALRFNTTAHMKPGPKSGIKAWLPGNSEFATRHNIGLLAMREAELVKESLPALDHIRYDKETQSFYDGNTRIPDAEIKGYFTKRIGTIDPEFARGTGEKTFRRALAILASRKTGAGRSGSLLDKNSGTPAHPGDGTGGGRLNGGDLGVRGENSEGDSDNNSTPEALKGIFYSKKKRQDGK